MNTRTYVRPLSTGGINAQGVPLGLVNWMNLNRSTTMPEFPLNHIDIEDENFLIPVIWNQLALTMKGRLKTRGFFTMYSHTWSRY